MTIKVLYVPGCPNYGPTLERIQKVLVSESLRADVEGIPVSSEIAANALEFPGSPTIRVSGTDVEPNHKNATGLACRLYANSGGVPSEEMLPSVSVRLRSRLAGGKFTFLSRFSTTGGTTNHEDVFLLGAH